MRHLFEQHSGVDQRLDFTEAKDLADAIFARTSKDGACTVSHRGHPAVRVLHARHRPEADRFDRCAQVCPVPARPRVGRVRGGDLLLACARAMTDGYTCANFRVDLYLGFVAT